MNSICLCDTIESIDIGFKHLVTIFVTVNAVVVGEGMVANLLVRCRMNFLHETAPKVVGVVLLAPPDWHCLDVSI